MENHKTNSRNEVIRVLQCTGTLNMGGAETMVMNVYREVNLEKIQFDFVVMGDEIGFYENEVTSKGGKIYHITKRSQSFLKSLKDLFYLVKSNEYSVIHFHTQNSFLTATQIIAVRMAGAKKIIVHSHNTSDWRNDVLKILHFICRPLMNILATKKLSCGEDAAKWLYGTTKNVQIIPLPVNCNKYKYTKEQYNKLRKENGFENAYIIAHTGRFWAQKNHDFLIDVFFQISRRLPDAVLFLMGDGELKSQIEAKVRQLGIESKVVFWGSISDVHNKLIMSDMFLFPSKYEGFPTVVLEAQAAGLPCYISDTITDEIAVTDFVSQIPLNLSARDWCDYILRDINEKKYDRTMGNELIALRYDISIVSDIFMQTYTEN